MFATETERKILLVAGFGYPIYEGSDDNLDAQLQVATIKFMVFKHWAQMPFRIIITTFAALEPWYNDETNA